MEIPWDDPRCVVCFRDAEPLSKAHLFPEFLGGFLWSRTHCRDCNSYFGHEVEAAAKRDDSFRYAIEHVLAGRLPDLARSFAEGQTYFKGTETAVIRARFKKGDYRIVAETSPEGVRAQDREQAREGLRVTLERAKLPEDDIDEALERFDQAPEGVMTEIIPGLSIRHGSVESWDLPFDGVRVPDTFAAAIAFHFLALRIRRAIYADIFDPLRKAIRSGTQNSVFVVERGITRHGYTTSFLAGTEQTMPHLVIRVQMLGELIWRLHVPKLCCSTPLLPRDGIGLDIESQSAGYLPPKTSDTVIPLPEA